MDIVEGRVKRFSKVNREVDVTSWSAKLATVEAAAAAAPNAMLRHYRISYRLSTGISAIDNYDHRLQALTGMIQSVKGDHHVATSTWDVSSHIASAEALTTLLSAPLDPELDALRVVQVSKSNRGSFGVDELEP